MSVTNHLSYSLKRHNLHTRRANENQENDVYMKFSVCAIRFLSVEIVVTKGILNKTYLIGKDGDGHTMFAEQVNE